MINSGKPRSFQSTHFLNVKDSNPKKNQLIRDVKKLVSLHHALGIEQYPASPGLRSFLETDTADFSQSDRGSDNFIKESTTQRKPEQPATRASLEDIRSDLGDCRRCQLSESRTHLVFGEGGTRSGLLVISEWPSIEDNLQNAPFSGEAGDLLTKMLNAIHLDRKDVYLTTLVKCHPPGNRQPKPEEIATCLPFLDRQISTLKPRVICTLGALATQTLLKTDQLLIRLRGKIHDHRGVPLIATFHPAFLLENPEMKRAAWIDLKMLRNKLNPGS
ncbi:uracil-DNA glycosylase [Thermodesulfobacteriota bacterium]